MAYLADYCRLASLASRIKTDNYHFSCGNEDLDDFFQNDSLAYEKQMMGKSYCFYDKEKPEQIVAAFTVSNASIHNRMLTSSAKKNMAQNVDREKANINFPAVLIGRLGINSSYQGKGIGTELMNFIKVWFIEPSNKTACRYLLVDAYNNPATLNYYQHNGFKFIFNNVQSEKKYRQLEHIEGELHTRLMYFDLILANPF